MITIHNFPRGARGLRVMWQCEEMALPYDFAAVTYPPSEGYLALHPLGSAPFLQDAGGVAISESLAMMLYLAQRYGPTPLLPTGDPAAMARVFQLTVLSEASLDLNPLMGARFAAPDADKRNWSVGWIEERDERVLNLVTERLGDSPFLVGEALTLADIAISTSLAMWTGALGKALPPALAAYQVRVTDRPAYVRARDRMAAG